MFSLLPCFATFSRSTTPRKPDSRANSPVISGRPIGLIESTSISPSSDLIDVLAFTVLRHFEQIDDAQEARLARQLPSDIRQTDWLDRIHFDLTFFHPVARPALSPPGCSRRAGGYSPVLRPTAAEGRLGRVPSAWKVHFLGHDSLAAGEHMAK